MGSTRPDSIYKAPSSAVRPATVADPTPSNTTLMDAAASNVACYPQMDGAAAVEPDASAPAAAAADETRSLNAAHRHPLLLSRFLSANVDGVAATALVGVRVVSVEVARDQAFVFGGSVA